MGARRSVVGVAAQLDHTGTEFDDFTPRAYAYATAGLGPVARANRAFLRRAMEAGGLRVYSGEWWHFDGPGAALHRPILPVPVDRTRGRSRRPHFESQNSRLRVRLRATRPGGRR